MFFKCINWYSYGSNFIITGYNINKIKCYLYIENYNNEIFLSVNKENYNEADALKIISMIEDKNISILNYDLCQKKSIYGLTPLYCYRLILSNSYDRYNIGKIFDDKKRKFEKITKSNFKKHEENDDELSDEHDSDNEELLEIDDTEDFPLFDDSSNINLPFKIELIYHRTPNQLKLITDLDISFCDWIEFEPNSVQENNGEFLYTIDYSINNIKKSENQFMNLEIELVNLAFDLETEDIDNDETNDSKNLVPLKCEEIVMISVCVQKGSDFKNRKIIKLTIAECNKDEIIDSELNIFNIEYIFCKNQSDLLIKFFECIKHNNPDVVTGYNTLTFDWSRILNMCLKYDIEPKYYLNDIATCIDFFPNLKNRIVKYSQIKSFFVENVHYLEIQGKFQLDLLKYFKRYYPTLPSFKLSYVAKEKLFNKNKLDVDYKFIKMTCKLRREIIELKKLNDFDNLKNLLNQYKSHSYIEDIGQLILDLKKTNNWSEVDDYLKTAFSKIAKYCIVDSMLCLDLCDHLNILPQCIQLSNIGCVTLSDNLNRGPTFRTESLLYKFTYHKDILLNKPSGNFAKQNEKKSFKGATVLEPIIGLHYGIGCYDFLSLYPSVMIQNNLCLSTLTMNSVDSNVFKINNETSYNFIIKEKRVGIIPEILINLMNARSEYKNELKQCNKDSPKYSILENKIWAVKIVMNSIYGITGSRIESSLRCIPVSETTTFIGRTLLEDMNPIIIEENHKTIYGDTDSNFVKLCESVVPYVTYNSKICTDHILENFKNLKRYSNHEIIIGKINDENLSGIKLAFEDILKTDYLLNEVVFKEIDDFLVVDIKLSINNRANEISKKLCKKITDKFSKDGRGEFVLEHEYSLEQFFITKKKKYVGLTYLGKKIEKGTLNVNRRSPIINKISYNNSIQTIFEHSKEELNRDDILINTLINDIKFTISNFKPEQFIFNGGVKTLIENVISVDNNKLFIDKHDQKFESKKKFDSRFVLKKSAHIATKVAFKVFKRDGIFPENSRINYIYYKDKYKSFRYLTKYFYDGKEFYFKIEDKEIKIDFQLETTGRKIILQFYLTDKNNLICKIKKENENEPDMFIYNSLKILKHYRKKITDRFFEIEVEYFNRNNPYIYINDEKVYLNVSSLQLTFDPLEIKIYENSNIYLNDVIFNEPVLKKYFKIEYSFAEFKNKNEYAIDYEYFYQNQDLMRISKIDYINSIIDHYESLFEIFNINKKNEINFEIIYYELGKTFNIVLKNFVKNGPDVDPYYNFLKPWKENNIEKKIIASKLDKFKLCILKESKKYIKLHALYNISEPNILLNIINDLKNYYNFEFNLYDFINFYENESNKIKLYNELNLNVNLKCNDFNLKFDDNINLDKLSNLILNEQYKHKLYNVLIYNNKTIKYSIYEKDILLFAEKLRIKLKPYYKEKLDSNGFYDPNLNLYKEGVLYNCILILSIFKNHVTNLIDKENKVQKKSFMIKKKVSISKEIKNTLKLKNDIELKNYELKKINRTINKYFYTNKSYKDVLKFCSEHKLFFSTSEIRNFHFKYKILIVDEKKEIIENFFDHF